MGKKWVVVSKGADFNQIAKDFGISPYLARIVRNRGAVTHDEIDRVNEFLCQDVDSRYSLDEEIQMLESIFDEDGN